MLPDKIKIKTLELVDGSPLEVEKDYFYQFNYNTITALRKAEGMSIAEVSSLFGELAKPEDERDMEKMAKANEYFGKFFFHALTEGQRMIKQPFSLSESDVQLFLNDPDNYSLTSEVAKSYAESTFKAEDEVDGEKKN